ncbi:MAG: SDR family NAD(P)-dependent oxidoreductase, partial [Planctomycetes bacterium]|nr:SDR family NAD(P)-dependent oxidoreductase [Planctomycetota bacterium]
GWTFGMFSDFILFSEESVYSTRFMNFGFTPGAGSTLIFPYQLGVDLSKEVLFTAQEYKGDELSKKGMLMPVLARNKVYDSAMILAERIALIPRNTLVALKQQFTQTLRNRLEETYKRELAMHEKTFVKNAKTLLKIQKNFKRCMGEVTVLKKQETSFVVSKSSSSSNIFTSIRATLKKFLAEELHMKGQDIEENTKFVDLGLDSITGVTWVRKINQEYGTSIAATKVYNYPTLSELSQYVMKEAEKEGTLTIQPPHPVVSRTRILPHSTSRKSTARHSQLKRRFTHETISSKNTQAVAVIGMAGKFPQAKNIEEFWQNIESGKDCIVEIPKDRWDIEAYYSEDSKVLGTTDCRWMGAIEEYDCFDPLFFNISPLEAESMDPQQRLFLEACWHSIEDSGYSPTSLSGSKCGVFAGCEPGDYGQQLQNSQLTAQGLMGLSTSILASRISYFLNLQGPCMSIDTACSSALVSIANACDSLVSGSSDLALAGGVCILSGPLMHIMTTKAGMLSRDGRCFTFDQRANGFVPGEGVGVVFLKRLKDAQKSGDPIYGVIRGWGVNQDGKTNGITAPNPESQTRLQQEIYDKQKINPEEIQLIEAHGTGTKLGDPIEIEGLQESFKKYTKKKNYCAIGSVKSNIGHSLTAAGVAGVIKLLLALRHKKLPPTINFEKLNEHISLEDCPFYVNTECKDWNAPLEGIRQAAISSFGLSGTNAHVVISEAKQQTYPCSLNAHADTPIIITLSAKTRLQLSAYAKSLLAFLEKNSTLNLIDLAYTFQVGRQAMNHRLAIVTRSQEELRQSLQNYIEDKPYLNLLLGEVRQESGLIGDTAEGVEYIEKLTQGQKLKKLAELWINGNSIDWQRLYDPETVKRLSGLPVYPFARERYWISEKQGKGLLEMSGAAVSIIHPLLHENTSDLSEQRFTSTFTGKEFFLNDHQVKGEKVLPGVCYLEMARAAVKKASGTTEEGATIHLKNIVWAQPIIVNGSAQKVHIGLFGEDSGPIQYDVYTESEREEESIVHSQGLAEVKTKDEAPPLDIQDLKSQMNQGTLSSDNCYQAFKEIGIEYGEGHRGIREIYQGKNQLLAKLSLPSSVQDTQNEYVLHPCLMDSALQSSIGLMLKNSTLPDRSETPPGIGRWPRGTIKSPRGTNKSTLRPSLPFALESLEIFGSCTSEMYTWVRYSGCNVTSNKVQKLNIDLCDEQGNICVKMRGFTSRVLEGEVGPPKVNTSPRTLLVTPVWKETAMLSSATKQEYAEHLILLCEMSGNKARELQSLIPGSHCENLKSEKDQIESRFTEFAVKCFVIIRELLEKKPPGKVLVQILVPNSREQSLFAGLSGLLKTAALENPKIIGQLIEINPEEALDGILGLAKENSRCPQDSHILYQEHKRLIASWSEIDVGTGLKPAQRLPWKDHGVYLITGGLGGLGVLFTKEILRQAEEVKIILTGRSELLPQSQSVLDELQTMGGSVDYQQVDVSALEQVNSLIETIQAKYGKLDGIIHSAGVISDNFILKKTSEEFRKVLLPKVIGTINLDKATRGITLDFFVLFSSGAGAMGNIGQVDYATANAFMDRFAAYRNQLVDSKERAGQTLSINWPLWREGGMRVDQSSETMMKQSTGMVPMQTETGIRAFYQSLNSDQYQSLVMEGNMLQMRAVLLETERIQEEQVNEETIISSVDPKTLEERTEQYLKKQISSVLKLPSYKIDVEAPLEKYGIDSILAMNLTNQLEKTFGSLSKTLFFEYQTIRELTRYFIESYESKLSSLFQKNSSVLKERKPMSFSVNTSALETKSKRKRRFAGLQTSGTRDTVSGPLEIAIIGLSGRYPESVNVWEYWKNLRDGKDCIIEVPEDRWNWREYFSEDRGKGGSHYSKWGGFIEGVDEFDPLFFNISPHKAAFIDPQERLFLEHAWMAMEDAGYTRESLQIDQDNELSGQVGVYVGVMYGEYQLLGAEESLRGNRMGFAGNLASIANRVSYVFNLHGPSMTVDTMCSSSLTSIHLACQDLKNGRTNLAIAGGVNISIQPNKYLMLSAGQFISTKGNCESFGEGGDGYIPGEGVGVVLL